MARRKIFYTFTQRYNLRRLLTAALTRTLSRRGAPKKPKPKHKQQGKHFEVIKKNYLFSKHTYNNNNNKKRSRKDKNLQKQKKNTLQNRERNKTATTRQQQQQHQQQQRGPNIVRQKPHTDKPKDRWDRAGQVDRPHRVVKQLCCAVLCAQCRLKLAVPQQFLVARTFWC